MMKSAFTHFMAAALLALGASSASAVSFELDFDTDPALEGVQFPGSPEWRMTGGNPNTGGYLKISDAVGSQRGAIIFPDLANGERVTDFSIRADLRVGGGTTSPADGFSFNFARPNDPVLDDGEDWASSPTGEANLPEEGTTTGLAIGFDEWFSGGADVIGMSIRIDNVIVREIPFPTLNGTVDDATSLQTGPAMLTLEQIDQLGWAPLAIDLTVDGLLTIAYKGREVFNEQVQYAASPGILVFGGRTGGSNAYHHIDNISLTINEAEVLNGDANGDGVVDLLDFGIIRDNFLLEGAGLSDGDVNLDRRVDFQDFRDWKAVFEAGGGVGAPASVPEPATAGLLMFGAVALLAAWRKSRSVR